MFKAINIGTKNFLLNIHYKSFSTRDLVLKTCYQKFSKEIIRRILKQKFRTKNLVLKIVYYKLSAQKFNTKNLLKLLYKILTQKFLT